jgi:16S rRNA processing protein RimM
VDGEQAEVVASKRSRGRPVIRLDREVRRGAELTVPRSELPPTGEDEYYAFELVGLEVEEEGGRALGPVAAVQPGVANDVLELHSGYLLPLVDACVLEVDHERRRILVAQGFAPSS